MRLSRNAVLLFVAVLGGATWSDELAHSQGGSGNPWTFPDFSASQIFQSPNYPPTKVYRSGASVRVETSAMTTLYVPDTKMVYTISQYPDGGRSCVAMKPDQASMIVPSPLEFLLGKDLKRTPLGTEVMEGHPSKVENVAATGPDGKIFISKVWEADDLKGIPVKIESQVPGGSKMIAAYRDIKLGTPDKSLFTPPANCTPSEKMWQDAGQKSSDRPPS
jgi:hypothetical protein